MLANKINYLNKKQNTVIFVENSLFLSGISRILEFYQIEVKKISSFEESYRTIHQNTIFICEVPLKEMEFKARRILLNDSSIKIIIIKDQLVVDEIEKLIDLGVKGFLLSDLDESYLVNMVKQVHSGNLFIDFRFTNKIMNEYKSYKKMSNHIKPVDTESLASMLTKRELEILNLLAEGCSNCQISKRLFISEKTVKNHVSNILDKLEVHDRLNAVIKAIKNNWIRIEVS